MIVGESGLEQLLAQGLKARDPEQPVLADAGQIIIHGAAGELEVGLGDLLLADSLGLLPEGLLLVGLGPAASFGLFLLGGLGRLQSRRGRRR